MKRPLQEVINMAAEAGMFTAAVSRTKTVLDFFNLTSSERIDFFIYGAVPQRMLDNGYRNMDFSPGFPGYEHAGKNLAKARTAGE